MDMNRDEPNFNSPPHNFIQMLNSIVQNNNIILRTEIININNITEESNRGCSEEYINNLEEKVVDEELLKKNIQCSICLEDFKLNDKYIALECVEPHIFHSGCETCSGIKEWLKRNNTCPMCRKEFPTNSENNNSLPNPNALENRISNIITNYINEIEESNEQRELQMAIEASLNDR
jgi:hypothetical protein